ncbi:hypothetical protein TorRG33x02_066130 [Trema orientale]|uniref:Transmembrane protein n=1 Tax=Trema orientale TaxID=63057 RepID=A0A2P5FIV1_TREOI|nr:hypothetical protein TorRG33x02_066130 [Trema orientale]
MVIVVVPVRRRRRRRRRVMRRRCRTSCGHLIRGRRRRELSLLGGFPFGEANARENARLLLAIQRRCCGGCGRSRRRDRGFGRGFRGRSPGGLGSPAVMMVVVVALAVVVVVVPVMITVPVTFPVVELIGLSLGRTWRIELSRRSLNG